VSAAWPNKALVEVCEIKPPKSEAKRKLKDADSVSFVPMEDLGINQKFLEPKSERKLGEVAGSYTYFADGDVLLAKITPCFENGKLGIARELKNGIGFGSSEYIVFRPNDELGNEYLYYFLLQNSFRTDGIRTMSGAVGHKRVSKEFIERCQIPLPPLPEQQRIVSILDDAFAGLATATDNAENNLKNARELFESTLNSIFIQTSWSERPLQSFCTVFEDGDWIETKDQSLGGIRLIQTGNVGEGYFKDRGGKARFISEATFKRLRCTEIFKGDCLISRLPDPVGRACLLPACEQRMITAVDCAIVRFEKDAVVPEFFVYYSQSRAYAAAIDAQVTGATRQRISRKNLGDVPIPVVALPEQRRVIGRLADLESEVHRLGSLYKERLSQIEELKQSILHKAFCGNLTSPPSQVLKEAAE
jgi:type I restriction enzyme S subunit